MLSEHLYEHTRLVRPDLDGLGEDGDEVGLVVHGRQGHLDTEESTKPSCPKRCAN